MLLSVQYLRGLAALFVVISHTNHKIYQIDGTKPDWFSIGAAGVDLFFMISGFIMCHVTEGRTINPISFLTARVKRIIPLYWALTLLAMLIYIIRPDLVNSSGGETTILHSFTLLPVGEKFLIQNGWTLSFEFLFYLIFSIALFTSQNRLRIASLIILILVALGLFFDQHHPFFIFTTNTILLEFTMGIFSYWYLRKYPPNTATCIALLSIGISLLFLANQFGILSNRVVSWGLPFLLVFIGTVGLENPIKNKSSNLVFRFFKFTGDASYSLYLIHPFALAAAAYILKNSPIKDETLLSYIILFSFAYISGAVCYKRLEIPLAEILSAKNRTQPAPKLTD